MFLSNFSVKKPVATIVIIVAMMAIGLLALSKLKVNQEPDVQIPIIVVDIPYPGSSPETSRHLMCGWTWFFRILTAFA